MTEAWKKSPSVTISDHKPTDAELVALAPHHGIIYDGETYVPAISVDELYVKMACPFCYSSYKNDGNPRANAKRTIHSHGSEGAVTPPPIGKQYSRTGHCVERKNAAGDQLCASGYTIVVTSNTKFQFE